MKVMGQAQMRAGASTTWGASVAARMSGENPILLYRKQDGTEDIWERIIMAIKGAWKCSDEYQEGKAMDMEALMIN